MCLYYLIMLKWRTNAQLHYISRLNFIILIAFVYVEAMKSDKLPHFKNVINDPLFLRWKIGLEKLFVTWVYNLDFYCSKLLIVLAVLHNKNRFCPYSNTYEYKGYRKYYLIFWMTTQSIFLLLQNTRSI